ncbi:hypothetical protein ACXEO8_06900 [Cytobacillus firmus]
MTPMPDHAKKKLLMIFVQNSVPQIIKEEREKQKQRKEKAI